MRLLAPAKINLHLRVGRRRPDGFHPLLTWMTTVGLVDNLMLEGSAIGDAVPPSREGAGIGMGAAGGEGRVERPATAAMSLLCDMPGLPCDERNLVVKIANAFRAELQSPGGGHRIQAISGDQPDSNELAAAERPGNVVVVRASLQKRIPVGAGLGGGSSDAARTLLGLNRLWRANVRANDLSAFAARFGSDLPFFFHGPSSVCRGRGEKVTPVARPAARWAVLVMPTLAMPTADVYRRFDAMGLGRERDLTDEPDWQAWAPLSSEDLLPRLVNDLEPAAFELAPELGALRARIEENLGRAVRMSGSGSSLFTLFDEESAAQEAAAHIERDTRERALAVEVSPIFRDDLNEEFEDR